jgi:exodeoxyribonuclease VII large subunit
VAVRSSSTSSASESSRADALSITEFYNRVDRALRDSFPGELWVTGEIRSMKVLTRGHCFIDLVDPTNARDTGAPTLNIKCWATQWRSVRSTLERLGITLDTGMVVRARGEVQFYKARGTVDFILRELDTDALLGKVAAERARLIKALVDENLFDRQRRLPTAVVPLRIGLVASPGTEGFNDFLGSLRGSGLAFAVTVVPTAVQGHGAPAQIAAAIAELQHEPLDVIVLVRGGGSKADLAAFDREPVARAVALSEVPVWTGIGHTGDQSVTDEVANRSFITPTELGQELSRLAVDYWRAVIEGGRITIRLAHEQLSLSERALDRHRHGMATGARSQVDRHADRLGHRARALRSAGRSQVEAHGRHLAACGDALSRSATRSLATGQTSLEIRTRQLLVLPRHRLQSEDLRVAQWRRLLGAFDYRRQLERGYSVTRDDSGRVVRSASELPAGSRMLTRLADGEVASIVAGGNPAAIRPTGTVASGTKLGDTPGDDEKGKR